MTEDSREKYVYFVRHGESEANVSDAFQGDDDPLTQLGKQQAHFMGERCTSLGAEVILTSPMLRAKDTADIIHEYVTVPLEVSDLLREYLPPASLIGRARSVPEARTYVDAMVANMHDPRWHYENEDNYFDLHARALETLNMLQDRSEKHILVVTHAGFMRILVTAMITEEQPDPELAMRLMRFLRPQTTGITICRYRNDSERNNWRLVSWNDRSHLADVERDEPM